MKRDGSGSFLQSCTARRLLTALVLPLIAVPLLTQTGQGARPGGVPVLLPPFAPVPPPQPFIQAVSPFTIAGFIQSATLDGTCTAHPFCGGMVVVNGITVTVPTNTISRMPASAMTWEELFTNAPAAYKSQGQTGLALSDAPKPLTTFEINIQGNRVDSGGSDRYIAGLISISNQSVNTGAGYINFIDYAKSEIRVSQTLSAGPAGARLRINTPHGRYGNPDPNADPRFTADEDNPTITARTGYPMCLPRVDPNVNVDSLCPQWNRPVDPYTGAFATHFTMPPATPGTPDGKGITHQAGYPAPAVKPDPFEQVPFEVGDAITYAGTLTVDSNGGQYISAHTVNADIGVFTAPGTWPVYVSLGEFMIGVGGTPNPLFPQEPPEKIHGDAFTTDSSTLVDIYAVDMDPCTGSRSHRFYITSNPFGPPLGGVKGRARFRSSIGNYLPPTREMAVSSRSLTGFSALDSLPPLQLTANGLAAGMFQTPRFEFVFPENLVMGSPHIPLTFQEFPFLVNGFGAYTSFDGSTNYPSGSFKQLDPWPGANVPAPGCTTGQTLLQPPVANAGAPQTVISENPNVVLDGGLSTDTNSPPLPLIYTWAQSSGPAVVLTDADKQKAHFVAPAVATGSANVVLGFQLAVCNGYTCGGVTSVNVTVTPALPVSQGPQTVSLSAAPGSGVQQASAASADVITVPGATYVLGKSKLQVAAISNAPKGTAVLTVTPIGATVPVSTANAASPTVVTSFAHGFAPGTKPVVTISGATGGNWSKLNGTFVVTVIDANTFSIPLDSSKFGSLTGTSLAFVQSFGPDVVCTYDPVADTYNILADIVNPGPDSVTIRSSHGGTITAPVLKTR